MAGTPYTRGRSREYTAIRMLREEGWLCIRSAKSHSPIDIFAGREGRLLLIQVKSGSARLRREETSELRAWAEAFGGDAEVWLFRKGGGLVKNRIYTSSKKNA